VALEKTKAHATARNNFKSQFVHAQRYVNDKSRNVSDTQLLEGKAKLELQVKDGREQQKMDNASIEDMQGRRESLRGAAGTLHDAATALLTEFRAISKTLEEIEGVIANDAPRFENTSLYQAAENIRNHLDKTDCDPFLLEDIRKVTNLAKNCFLEVQSKDVSAAKKANDRAVTAYRDHKNGFCGQVASGKIKGLSALNAEWLQAQERFDASLEMKEQIEAGIKDRRDRCQQATADLESMRDEAARILSTLTMDSERSLEILDEAMATTPNARFYVQASVISGDMANDLMLRLYGEFEGKRRAQASDANPTATQRRQRKSELEYLRGEIYRALFGTVSVDFRHPTIWKGEKHPLTSRGLSEGMKTAVSLMWIAKLAEFRLRQAVDQRSGAEGARRQRQTALRKDRYFMILDGLFSNLSHDEMIDSAMESLRQSTGHFQLIGMIHHPRYINNPKIFPSYFVGRPFTTDDGKHSWLTVDHERDAPGSLGVFGSHYTQKGAPSV
jgi:chaperonin cofactor prefoldin